MNPVFFRGEVQKQMTITTWITEKNFGERFLSTKNPYPLNINILKNNWRLNFF